MRKPPQDPFLRQRNPKRLPDSLQQSLSLQKFSRERRWTVRGS